MQVLDPRLQFTGGLKSRPRTDHIVLHHADASRCTVNDVHRWHLARGWSGIGYHFFVDKAGRVYRGRPIDTVGAHCYGYNQRSVGICCEGDYEEEQSMPAAQWRAVLELVAYLKQMYPGAKVVGHRELSATACPGRYFPLAEIKAGKGPVADWKEQIMEWARRELGISPEHRADDPAPKWFVLAIAQRVLTKLGE